MATTSTEIEIKRDPVPTTLRDFFFSDDYFKTNWDNFERARENMLAVSDEMFNRFSNQYADLYRSPFSTLEKGVVPVFPRRWMLPSFPALQQQILDLDMFKEADTDVIRFSDTGDKLEVSLDTHR